MKLKMQFSQNRKRKRKNNKTSLIKLVYMFA